VCIIIAKQPRQTIKKSHIYEGFDSNPNGAGFMYLKDGHVTIDKGYSDPKKFYRAFKDVEREYPNSPIVLHMRIATSGKTDVENCHPFYTRHGVGFCHNGIISQYSYANSQHSDTWHYVESVLNKLPDKFWTDKGILGLIETTAVLSHSKFVLLTPDGPIIFNEMAGEYHQGIWYSNNTYKQSSWLKYMTDDTPYLSRDFTGYRGYVTALDDEDDGMGGTIVKYMSKDVQCDRCRLKFHPGDIYEFEGQSLCLDCACG